MGGWFGQRMREPSSQAGIGAIVAGLAYFIPPQYQGILQLLAVLFGSAAVAMKEKGGG